MADQTTLTSEVPSRNPDGPPVREPRGKFPSSDEMEASAATFARIQAASAAVTAAAFVLAAGYALDEPVPLWPTAAGEAAPCPPEPVAS